MLAAAIICLIVTTVFAAFNLLNYKDVVNKSECTKPAWYFEEQGAVSDTSTGKNYKATVLGVATSENSSKFKITLVDDALLKDDK